MKTQSIPMLGLLLLTGLLVHSVSAQSVAEPNANTTEIQSLIIDAEAVLEHMQRDFDQQSAKVSRADARHKEILSEQYKSGYSKESYPELLRVLQVQRVELEIEIAGLQARRELLVETINEQQQQEQASTEPLMQLLALEQKALAATLKKIGTGQLGIEAQEVAKRRVLNVQIQIAESKQADRGILVLHEQLLDISLELAEKRARLQRGQQLQEPLLEFNDVLIRLKRQDSEVRKLEQERNRMRQDIEGQTSFIRSLRDRLESADDQ